MKLIQFTAMLLASLFLFVSTVSAAPTQTTLKLNYLGNQSGMSGWGGSFRVDSTQFQNGFGFRYEGNSTYDATYNLRLSRNLNRYVGVFGGYSGVTLNNGAYASGWRFGADFRAGAASGPYLSGEAGYRSNVAGNTAYDYRVSVGVEGTTGYGVEAGYRWFTVQNMPALDVNGYVVGLTYRR